MAVFEQLQKQAGSLLPKSHAQLGDLVSIDGSLIDSVLSMDWADYRAGSKKAKLHLGFNINQGIPQKLFLTDGKSDERPFAHKIIEPGQSFELKSLMRLEHWKQNHRMRAEEVLNMRGSLMQVLNRTLLTYRMTYPQFWG